MFYLNLDRVKYERINLLLPDICPDIKIELRSMDINLERLGFCESAPCVVAFDISKEDYKILLNELMDMETDALSSETWDYFPDDDPRYIRYKKYSWMQDVLYYAEYRES